MENLASACIAYANSQSPMHLVAAPTWSGHAAAIAILGLAVIGWFWLMNKGLEFAVPRIVRDYRRAKEAYAFWRYPEATDADEFTDLSAEEWAEMERYRNLH